MVLVRIDPGEFWMGSPDSDKDAKADEKPRHRVRITRPFYLGKYEVTQAEYKAVTGEESELFQRGTRTTPSRTFPGLTRYDSVIS